MSESCLYNKYIVILCGTALLVVASIVADMTFDRYIEDQKREFNRIDSSKQWMMKYFKLNSMSVHKYDSDYGYPSYEFKLHGSDNVTSRQLDFEIRCDDKSCDVPIKQKYTVNSTHDYVLNEGNENEYYLYRPHYIYNAVNWMIVAIITGFMIVLAIISLWIIGSCRYYQNIRSTFTANSYVAFDEI
jgi:hypothetical protein